MTHIGTPPAGWYADPSGAHRARYWDGATWTEQVRDDVLGDAAGAAAEVAEVAHAVAAVAEGGPVPIAPEPVPTFVEVAPVESAPVAGWYPDPANRHQARHWDGGRWTERVADNGLESADPIPEVAIVGAAATSVGGGVHPGSATLLDPEYGAWTAQLLDAVNADGTPVSAGQASMATLSAAEEDSREVRHSTAPPTAKVRIAGAMVLGGAIALLVGSGLDWMKVTGPRVGDYSASTGVDLGDGRVTIVLAVALAVLGAAIMTGRLSRFGGSKVAAMGALVAGAAAAAVTAVDITDVANRATRLGVPSGAVTDVGIGLWLCFIGALVALGGGLMAFANRSERDH